MLSRQGNLSIEANKTALLVYKSSPYTSFTASFSPFHTFLILSGHILFSTFFAHLPSIRMMLESLLEIPARLILASSGFLYAMLFAIAINFSKVISSRHSFLSEITASKSVNASGETSPSLNLGTSHSFGVFLQSPCTSSFTSSFSISKPQAFSMVFASFDILLSSSCLYSKIHSSYSFTDLGFSLFKAAVKIIFLIFLTFAKLQAIRTWYSKSLEELSMSTGANLSSKALSPSPNNGIIVSALDFISSSVSPICSKTFTSSFLSPGLCAIFSA